MSFKPRSAATAVRPLPLGAIGLSVGYGVVLVALAALASVACGGEARAENKKGGGGAAKKGGPAAPVAADAHALDERTRLGTPIRHENLTLVPILATKDVKDDKEYLTLDEAFDQNLVKVRELDSESVNTLSLENKSDRPMFVMSGEVILGGKQDRIIGKDRIIPPRQAVTVDVFCVEHGRWSEEGGTSREFRSAKVLAHTNLRLQASYEAQDDVWREVKAKNEKRAESNATDTYRATAQSKKAAKDIAPYEKALAAGLAAMKKEERARLLGFVVVLNGEIVGVESFGSPKLFEKLSGKIVRSYIVEAIDAPAPKGARLAWAPTAKDVKHFAEKVAKAAETTVHQDKDGKATKQKKGAGVAETSVTDSAPAAAQPELYKRVDKVE